MKYYSLLFVINAIFWTLNYFIGFGIIYILGFIGFDIIYLFCVYVWVYQKDLFKKIIDNCNKSESKPIIINTGKVKDYLYNNQNQVSTNIKRNVGESMKKMVASNQQWKCKKCGEMLNATYEIDHLIPLYKGGGNNYENLEALCRNCHGLKTMNDKLIM